MAIPPIAPYSIPTQHNNAGASSSWVLHPERSALLVHDMQEYFLAAYDHSAEPMNEVIANISQLIKHADELDIPIYFSAQPPRQQQARRGLLSDVWGQGIQTDSEAQIIPELAPADHHHVITKWRYSAFERTDLEQSLSFSRRDQLLITGVYGHMGCKVTAVDAFMKDIEPFLISDAIADFSKADHADTTSWVSRRCGRVMGTADAITQLTASN
ncbi:isochorismatase family protein [Corynebacterium suicordis]